MNYRRGLMATAVAFALMAGACGNSEGGGSSSGDLPLLPGSTAAAAGRATAESDSGAGGDAALGTAAPHAAIDMAIAPGEPYRPVEYRLADDIDEMGGKQGAYRLEAAVDEDRVEKLADAFDIEGTPREENGTWTVGDPSKGGRFLVVDAQGSFSAYDGRADAVATSSAEASCTSDGACTTPAVQAPPPARDLPSDDDAEEQARELFDAIGIDVGDEATVERSDYNVYVAFPMTVEGVEVEGLMYTAAFGDGGSLQSANGTLAKPALVGDYPLVSTADAYERWQGETGTVTRSAAGATEPAIAVDTAGTAGTEAPADGAGAAEPAPAPMPVPPEETSPPVTLEPEIRELDTVEIVLVPQYGRCPGDAMYLVPAYRLAAGDEAYASVPAVEEEYLATSDQADEPASDKAVEETEPCPGVESVPGREPDAPNSDGYPPVTIE